jgi:hypothetical protein
MQFGGDNLQIWRALIGASGTKFERAQMQRLRPLFNRQLECGHIRGTQAMCEKEANRTTP